MRKSPRIDLIILGSLAICFIVASVFNSPSDKLLEFKPQVVPPKGLNHATFGFRNVISDSLWLRTLQADDFCEVNREKAAFNKGVLLEDALKDKLKPSRCHKGWIYQMLDLVTDLNPEFHFAYKTGGIQLSIAVDDREGARLLFEKGIKANFEDWQLLYYAAYHYIFEVQNAERARELLHMASIIPHAPYIVNILAARLDNLTGRRRMAIDTLEQYLKSAKPGSEGYAHAVLRLEQLKKFEAEEQAKKNK